MKIDRKRAAGRLGRGLLATVILLMTASLIGCTGRSAGQSDADGSADPVTEPGRLKVVTTLFPYYDFVRQIAGDDVELTMIVPAGMDSHSFEPTPADMRTMQAADLMICNGGAMETWVESVLDALDTSDMRVVTLMDYVDTYEEEIVEGMEDDDHDHAGHDHSHDSHDNHGDAHENHDDHDVQDHDGHEIEIEYDEHIWTSPVNAMTCVEVIRDTLCEMDPEHAAEYGQRAADYLDVLKNIDADFREVSENRVRNLIVVGDKFPFRYLAEEYGLSYRAAFSGCSSDTEPSAQTIAYLIDKIRDEKIPVIYYLELSSHRVSDIIGEETGAEPLLLHSCHNVTRAEFERGITYEALMRQNVENLRAGIDE